MTIHRIKNLIFLHLQRLPFKSKKIRPFFVKLGGVNIVDCKNTFIGEDVCFDTNYPENIEIQEGVYITKGCVILAHYFNAKNRKFDRGNVLIKKNAFIGCNSVICKPVVIGENAVIGAGSIVNKDIPDNEIWAGNPVRFIRKINE